MRVKTIAKLAMLLAAVCSAQAPMTNESIKKMVKAGLNDDIVIGTIKSQPANYSTAPDDLIGLKTAGVSDRVISALVGKMSAGAVPESVAPASVASKSVGPVSEVGVYLKKDDGWVDLAPEVVNFKTGGVLKNIGSAGIVKGDVNGHVNGEHSKTVLKTPFELLVYTSEGTAITEYQLLRLRAQKDSREFRTVTGGVMHVSGGQTRDALAFENKKIAPRTYQIGLPNLTGGDYGLLPPASSDATGGSGRLGKIYSFRILD